MRRALKRLILVGATTVLLFLYTLTPFLWPRTDRARRADAVFILSGDHGERLPQALRLMEKNVASTLIFVGTIDRALEDRLCRGGQVPYEVLCLRPVPDNTRQEARVSAQLARNRRWGTIVVVTSTQHVARSSLLFRRCFGGKVQMVAGRPPFSRGEMARQIVHEWLGTAHALIMSRSC